MFAEYRLFYRALLQKRPMILRTADVLWRVCHVCTKSGMYALDCTKRALFCMHSYCTLEGTLLYALLLHSRGHSSVCTLIAL